MSDECAMILAYFAMNNNTTLESVIREIEDVINNARQNKLFPINKPTVEEFLNTSAAMRNSIGA